ncbi:Sialic acid O-acyltransferase, NeuD [Candidatus Magnetomorum sp. HK-1]|nr:Sialic acid O-acyltransferase, NeuD [Candidatus Magnetomorum sp. HK-1]
MDNIVIIGSSGHAKVIIDIVEKESRYRIAGIIDPHKKKGEKILGYSILGQKEDLPQLMISHAIKGAIVAIGDNFTRSAEVSRLREICPDIIFVSAKHPKASIAKDVTIGEGTVIMAGANINPSCSIGLFCIINTNSSLDHDSEMKNFSSIAPGVTTGGNCKIDDFTAISIGATLIHGIHIGEHTVIGAGSTVIKDIQPYKIAYGTPAKVIRDRIQGEKYF